MSTWVGKTIKLYYSALAGSKLLHFGFSVHALQLHKGGEIWLDRGHCHGKGSATASAENGISVSRGHQEKHLCRSAGLCPGSNERRNAKIYQEQERSYQDVCSALQSQKAVSAYFTSRQILTFGLAEQCSDVEIFSYKLHS